VESRTDDPTAQARLFPGERALLARAVAKRCREFATTRLCAHQALSQLGYPPGPVLRGADRQPLWPDGVVGSLTHCPGYRAAAVARQVEVAALGIDAEPAGPLPEGVFRRIARPAEQTMVARLAQLARPAPGQAGGRTDFDRLLFSAKEACYKAWFPLAGRWLGFGDVQIGLDPGGSFSVRFLVPLPHPGLADLRGRWLVEPTGGVDGGGQATAGDRPKAQGLVVTAVWLGGGPTASFLG